MQHNIQHLNLVFLFIIWTFISSLGSDVALKYFCELEQFFLPKGIYLLTFLASMYLFKVSNTNTRKMCEICSELTIKTPEWRQWRRSSVFIVNFEQISHVVMVFPLLYWTSKCRLGSDAILEKHICFTVLFVVTP